MWPFYTAALMPYAYKSTTFCAKKWRFDGIMMGHEGQFGLLHRALRIEICTKKSPCQFVETRFAERHGQDCLVPVALFLNEYGEEIIGVFVSSRLCTGDALVGGVIERKDVHACENQP